MVVHVLCLLWLVLQDFSSLMQDHPGVYTSPSVSFGLKQLVPQQVQQGVSTQHHSYSSGYGTDMQQYHRQQEFAELFGTVGDSQQSVVKDEESLFYFRHITVKNCQSEDLQLIDVRFSQKLPLWPHSMALIDDAGISTVTTAATQRSHRAAAPALSKEASEDNIESANHQQQRQTKRSNKKQQQRQQQLQQQQAELVGKEQAQQQTAGKEAAAGHEEAQQEGIQGVLLRQGEEYSVTVVLNCQDGPHRK